MFAIGGGRLFLSEFVELVHRDVDAGEDEAPDDFHGRVDGRPEHFQVLVGVMSQHPVYLSAARVVVADAHAQAGVVAADELLDVPQSVVAAVRSAPFQAEGARRQGHVVRDDEQAALVDVFLVEPVAHGVPREVHEGGGFQEDDLPPLDGSLGDESVAPVLKNNIGRFCESVQYHESCVVPGPLVLLSGVAQSADQILVQSSVFFVMAAAEDSLRCLPRGNLQDRACVLFGSLFRLGGSCGLDGVTCRLDGAYDHLFRRDQLEPFEAQFAHLDALAQLETRHVDVEVLRNLLVRRLDVDLADRHVHASAVAYTLCQAGELHGNTDGDGLLVVDLVEVNVEQRVRYRVELQFLENRRVRFAVDDQLDDVDVRCVDHLAQFRHRSGEGDCYRLAVLVRLAIEVAGDEALLAEQF